jgi:hypothetical protein
VFADTAAYGGLFLLALLVPAWAGDHNIIPAGAEPAVVVAAGVASAAGVGSLLSLLGTALWHLIWPYSPTGGINRLLGRRRAHWLRAIGPQLGVYGRLANAALPDRPEGDRTLVAAEFLWYRDGPESVREWARRRHERFEQSLSAAAAIALGLVAGRMEFPVADMMRLALEVAFFAIGATAVVFADGQRKLAESMEAYWFALREEGAGSHD